jgi:hypothetical protein
MQAGPSIAPAAHTGDDPQAKTGGTRMAQNYPNFRSLLHQFGFELLGSTELLLSALFPKLSKLGIVCGPITPRSSRSSA